MDNVTYTEEELKNMTRVELRRAAIKALEIDNKECSNTKSVELIGRIIEKQDGGGKSKTNGKSGAKSRGGKAAARATPTQTKSRTAKPKNEPAADEGTSDGGVDMSQLVAMIEALGAELDKTQEANQALLEEAAEQRAEVQRMQFLSFGLITDLFKMQGEPDELEQRMTELQEEWEADTEETEGDSEGNDNAG